MGSTGSSQKKNDWQPLPRLHEEGEGGSSGSKAAHSSQECPQVFRVEISKTSLVKEGVQLTLSSEYELTRMGVVVGILSKTHQKMIERCAEEGVLYKRITVVEVKSRKGNKFYAEFRQE